MNNAETRTMYQKENPFSYPTNTNDNSKDFAYDFTNGSTGVFADSNRFQLRGNNGIYEQFEDPEMVSNNVSEPDPSKDFAFFDSIESTVDPSSTGNLNGMYASFDYEFSENVDEIHGIQDFQEVENGASTTSPQCANPQLLMLGPPAKGKRRHEDEPVDLEETAFYGNSFMGMVNGDSNWGLSNKDAELTADFEWKKSIDSEKTLVPCDESQLDLSKLSGNSKILNFDIPQSEDTLHDCNTPNLSYSSHESTSSTNAKPTMQDVDLWNRQIEAGGRPEHEPNAFNGNGHASRFEDLAEDYQSHQRKIPKNNSISLRSSRTSVDYRNGSSSDTRDGSRSGLSSPNRRKKQRISPKQIPSHFVVQPGYKITLQNSHVKCLDVNLDYHGYEGKITKVILNNDITNYHRDSGFNPDYLPPERREVLHMPYEFRRGEYLEGDPWCTQPDGLKVELHCHMGLVERKIYIRDISEIFDLVTRITYLLNTEFDINRPYEPQYTRYETDQYGKFINETKCGLCAFCKVVKFLPFKNSSYLSHMTLEHGVFSDHFVVPEGTNFGKYIVSKGDEREPEKTKEIEALQCPDCFEIVEMNCWSTKKNPLLKYFRHYKKEHSKKQNNVLSKVNPLEYKARDSR